MNEMWNACANVGHVTIYIYRENVYISVYTFVCCRESLTKIMFLLHTTFSAFVIVVNLFFHF